MSRSLWRSRPSITAGALALVLSASSAWACPSTRDAPRCRVVFAAPHRLHVAHGIAPRHHHSRTGWRPVIPPFDQAEAEAEVHEIAPYRTYPFYPLFPEVAPAPYVYGY